MAPPAEFKFFGVQELAPAILDGKPSDSKAKTQIDK
jgi:hypothetical protein